MRSIKLSRWGISALGGLAAAVLVTMVAPPAVGAEPLSILTASRGEVSIARNASITSSDIPLRASLREVLHEGDVLITGPDGRAKLLVGDDALIVIGREAELKIDRVVPEPAPGEPSVRLTVKRGLVRAAFQPSRYASPKPALAIETPMGTWTARGDSEGFVDVSQGTVRFWSVEATWDVSPSGPGASETVHLAPGHVMDLRAGMKPGEAKPTQAEELQAVRAELTLMETAFTRPKASHDRGDFIYEDYASRGWMFASSSERTYRTAAASEPRRAQSYNGYSTRGADPSVSLVSAIPQGFVNALVSVFGEGER